MIHYVFHACNYICKGWTRGDNTRFLVPNPGGNLPYGVARLSRRHRCWAEDFVVQEIDLGEGLLTYFFACRRATVLFQALINGSTIQEAVMTGYVPEVARSSGAQWLYGGDLLFCAYNDGISGALDCFICAFRVLSGSRIYRDHLCRFSSISLYKYESIPQAKIPNMEIMERAGYLCAGFVQLRCG